MLYISLLMSVCTAYYFCIFLYSWLFFFSSLSLQAPSFLFSSSPFLTPFFLPSHPASLSPLSPGPPPPPPQALRKPWKGCFLWDRKVSSSLRKEKQSSWTHQDRLQGADAGARPGLTSPGNCHGPQLQHASWGDELWLFKKIIIIKIKKTFPVWCFQMCFL